MAILNKKSERSIPFLLASLSALAFVWLIQADDYILSVVYCLTAVYSTLLLWNAAGRKITLLLCIILCYHLFIGGRFWVYLFSQEYNSFEITWFANYAPTGEEKYRIFSYVYLCVVMITLGACVEWSRERRPRFIPHISVDNVKIDQLINRLFPILILFSLYHAYNSLSYALSHGYETIALNADAESNLSYSVKFSRMSIIVFTGMAIAYGQKKTVIKYISLLLFTGLVIIICGSRGTFGSVVMIMIWAYSRYHKLSLKKLAIYGVLGLVSLLLLVSISFRETGSGGVAGMTALEALTDFFYSNGVSLMVFALSTTVTGYPTLQFFQTFFPGVNFLYSHISGIPLKPEQASFQGHLCNTLDSDLFYSGAGLGWTMNGDLYLFSGGILIFYCLLAYLLGKFISYIDVCSNKSRFYLYMAGAVSFDTFALSRGSMSNLFAMIPYIYIYFLLVIYLTRFIPKREV